MITAPSSVVHFFDKNSLDSDKRWKLVENNPKINSIKENFLFVISFCSSLFIYVRVCMCVCICVYVCVYLCAIHIYDKYIENYLSIYLSIYG